jgi:hypothetical protein
MKNLFVLISVLLVSRITVNAQQTYCDFESTKVIHFGMHTGMLDSAHVNVHQDLIDSSAKCGLFVRDTSTYNWLRVYTNAKMMDITPYASNAFNAPHMRMKVYSTAPIGTAVQIQLGISSVDNYPAGIHSIYQAMTTTQNAWETLTFNYYQTIPNSLASPTNIDKMIILYELNSNSLDTMYFDEIVGPTLVSSGVSENAVLPFELAQNEPNPVQNATKIDFALNAKGNVSLTLFDLLGNPVKTLVSEDLASGYYSIPVETADLPDGIYFYVFTMNGASRSMKMVVNR